MKPRDKKITDMNLGFGITLCHEMKGRGTSNKEMCAAIGLKNDNMLYRYFNGENFPEVEKLIKMSIFFGDMSFDRLLGRWAITDEAKRDWENMKDKGKRRKRKKAA